MQIPNGVIQALLKPVTDSSYFEAAMEMISNAHHHILCSLFMVDLYYKSPAFEKVFHLLVAMQNAVWEGADVRLIVSGSRSNLIIAESAITAKYISDKMKIPCFSLLTTKHKLSHMKMLIADDKVLLGSHNWSPGSMSSQTQDSVLVDSPEFSAYCGFVFQQQWNKRSKHV